jgi:hypothetical protein
MGRAHAVTVRPPRPGSGRGARRPPAPTLSAVLEEDGATRRSAIFGEDNYYSASSAGGGHALVFSYLPPGGFALGDEAVASATPSTVAKVVLVKTCAGRVAAAASGLALLSVMTLSPVVATPASAVGTAWYAYAQGGATGTPSTCPQTAVFLAAGTDNAHFLHNLEVLVALRRTGCARAAKSPEIATRSRNRDQIVENVI